MHKSRKKVGYIDLENRCQKVGPSLAVEYWATVEGTTIKIVDNKNVYNFVLCIYGTSKCFNKFLAY